MRIFNGKGGEPLPADSTNKLDGYCAANISIAKKPQYREVLIIIIDCASGETVYKASYRSKAHSDFGAHNVAVDMIRAYAADNGYVLMDEPTSNAQLPSVTTHLKNRR